ncbi:MULTISPECIES: hypothetical protein [Kordiimonas]|jgi:hypothetical protein|uniref:hypothetical protein n=1 Tax=Kordiimonas TaxID=288021 RepID=UPI00257EBEE5|nr:hypothetical protein [Kordiimonas sp. UBA4487]
MTRDFSLLEQAKVYSFDYLSSLANRRVFPSIDSLEAMEKLDAPLPESPHQNKKCCVACISTAAQPQL